uniref:Uncharacterized protein n=1 Tax=Romanomermis culicivorax TaxID=13658 RepID=A0A915I677_ROMCU
AKFTEEVESRYLLLNSSKLLLNSLPSQCVVCLAASNMAVVGWLGATVECRPATRRIAIFNDLVKLSFWTK